MQKEDLSEESIRANCPHCDRDSQAFNDYLEETEHFHIVCDHHPLVEGHLLIIPKVHISCIGAFSEEMLADFMTIYERVSGFIQMNYGVVSAFEHGKLGQTVFHCHIHLLPFYGASDKIVPEGKAYMNSLSNIQQLREVFDRDEQYLFFSVEDQAWTVDTALAAPRFFRDRFAQALGNPERGNWKVMHEDVEMMAVSHLENLRCQELWRKDAVLSRGEINLC